MKHYTPLFRRPNARALAASLIAYLMLAAPMAPLAAPRKAASPRPTVATPQAPASGGALGAVPAPVPAPLAAASLSVTKTDSFNDIGNDGQADPGQTITYTVTITNNGNMDATNVTLTDTPDTPNNNVTLQAGTVMASPIGFDDAYNAIGNVGITVPDGANDLLANDIDPDSGNNTGLTVSAIGADNSAPFSHTTGNGGLVESSTTDGAFTYKPAAGFSGADTFTYTTVDGTGKTNTATATVNVSAPAIWFIDDNAAADGDGTLARPFNCYVGTSVDNTGPTCFSDSAADDPGDIIFLYAGNYTGGYTLLNNQRLLGQGMSATLASAAGVTPEPYSDALPANNSDPSTVVVSTSAPATNAVNLAVGNSNTLRGFTLGNTTGADIASTAGGFGTLTASEVVLNGTGQALNLDSGALNATFASISSNASGAQGIMLDQVTGALTATGGTSVTDPATQCVLVTASTADLNFGNTSCTLATDGISLQNNSAGTRTFGTLSVSGASLTGFLHANGGGATNVGATTITNPGGVGIDIDSSNANISFGATTVDKSATGNIGVDLTNNASRTIGFTSLAVTTTNAFALNANNSGTVNAGGGSLTQSGAGGGAAQLVGTALGLTFATVSSNGGGNGLIFTGGSGTFTSGTTNLQNNAGVGLLMQTASAVAASFGNTTVNSSAGDAVDLSGNTGNVTFAALDLSPDTNQRGLDAANVTGTITSTSGTITTTGAPALNIAGPAGRTPLALALTDISVTNSTTLGIDLNLVSGNLTLPSGGTGTEVNISNPSGIGIQVRNSASGTLNFGDTNVSGSGGTGVVLGTASNGNAGSVTFNDLDISPDAGQRGLHAVQNTGTLSTSSGDIISTTGIPVEIVGTSSGSRAPLNVTLNRVSSNGASNGIILTNTNGPGGSVGFVVNGDGSNTSVGGNASGGLLQNNNGGDDDSPADGGGIGVRLVDADEVVLRRMTITTSQNYGIYGERATNFTFEFSTVNGTNGTDSPGGGINNVNNPDASIYFNELTQSALFKDSLIEGGLEDNVRIINTSGTLNRVTFDNVTVDEMDLGNARGDNAVFIQGRNAAVVNVTIQNSDLNYARGDIFQFDLTNTASGDLIFDNNTVNNQHPFVVTGGGGITLTGGGSAAANTNLTYEFDNNTFRGARGSALLILMQTGAGSAAGRIEGNTFGVTGVLGSCSSEATCVEIRTEGRGAQTALVNNNTIQQYANAGVYFEFDGINTGGSTGTIGALNATVTNNILREPVNSGPSLGALQRGVEFNFGASAADNYQGCADVRANDGANAGGEASVAESDYILRQRAATTLRIPGYGGAAGDENAVEAFIQAQNTGAETVFAAETTAGAPPNQGGGFPGGAACTQPPAGPVIFNASSVKAEEQIDNAQSGETVTVEPVVVVPAESRTATGERQAESSMGGGVTSRPFVAIPSQPKRNGGPRMRHTAEDSALRIEGVEEARTLAQSQKTKWGKPRTHDVPKANPPVVVGNNISWNIGTLPAGKSVTITFDVVIENPFDGAGQVSNQATVTADGGINVLSDDPSVGGGNDPTVTPVVSQPDITISDATGSEPGELLFTVALSAVSGSVVSVNFTTNDGTATVADGDYTTTSGTVTFQPGQRVQTIAVPILSNAPNNESPETITVTLSMPTNGVISSTGVATGTITEDAEPGTVLISEVRTAGPAGTGDWFVEVYNNSDTPHTVDTADDTGYGLFKKGADCDATPVLVGTVPEGTVIPPRGHYLITGNQYSLANYGGTGAAAGDLPVVADIGTDSNVGLFDTSDLVNISTLTRLDAVGFGINNQNNCKLLREGSNLGPVGVSGNLEHSFFRKLCDFQPGQGCFTQGTPKDTGDNSSDFTFGDTQGTEIVGTGQRLAAPGPENMGSPRKTDLVASLFLDSSAGGPAPPNRVRDLTPGDPSFAANGTMSIRRRLVNNTGAPVTRLRFRISEMTTFPTGPGQADLRAISSMAVSGVMITNDPGTCGGPSSCTVTVEGTTLETPPAQPNGGGLNATLTVTLGTPLAHGSSVNVQFLLGVQNPGNFRFLIVSETLP